MNKSSTTKTTEDAKQKVIKYIKRNGYINNRQCRELLGFGYDQVTTLFNSMLDAGELVREGKTASIKYRLPVTPKKKN